MSDRESIIARVRKLLARARHPATERPEAETAASLARELMKEHQLADDDVAEVSSYVQELELPGDGMMAIWRVGLLAVIAGFFDCQVVRKRSLRGAEKVKVIGVQKNLKLVVAAFQDVLGQIGKLCDTDMPSKVDGEDRASRGMREAYRKGCVDTIRVRMREIRERSPWDAGPEGGGPSAGGPKGRPAEPSRGARREPQAEATVPVSEKGLAKYLGEEDRSGDIEGHMKGRYGGAPRAKGKDREFPDDPEEAKNQKWAYVMGRAAGETIRLPSRPRPSPEAKKEARAS